MSSRVVAERFQTSIKTRLRNESIIVGLVTLTLYVTFRFSIFKPWFDVARVYEWLRFEEWAFAAFMLAFAFGILSSIRWRAFEQLSSRLYALYRTSRIASSALDSIEVIRHAVGAVRDIMGYNQVAVLMLDADRFTPAAWAGYQERPPELRAEHGILGQVVRTGRPVFLPRAAADSEYLPLGTSAHSAIVYPLTVEGRTVGVLLVETLHRQLMLEDLEVIGSVASQLGVALGNALRYERTKEQAIRDGLTGLYNHAYLQERLREELSRAQRYQRPLSLVLADLDHFKVINDTFGHTEGDRFLRLFSEILRAHFREIDLPARYGGEEFAVIMIEASREEAVAAAERVRQHVDRSGALDVNGQKVSMKASFGVAAFPEDAIYVEELIARADEALYGAKRLGRNRVGVARSRAGPSPLQPVNAPPR